MPLLDSVNIGRPEPNPYKSTRTTGIGKLPQPDPVEVRAPGPKTIGLGSGLVGDHIGDTANHGGNDQAVYAFAREDLDAWEQRLDRELSNGFFGENLTTRDLDVNGALLGEEWQIGAEVVLAVTFPADPVLDVPRLDGEKGWLKTFTQVARPGAYLRVVQPGEIRGGDPIEVSFRPDHEVTVSHAYRAVTLERDLLPSLLAADNYLDDELRDMIGSRRTFDLG